MEILAVRQARLIAFLKAEELNPEGKAIVHDFMKGFVERYSFIKFPTQADEILDTENKGLIFELGKFGKFAIDKLTLFDWGIVVDTSASTDVSEEILQDMLKWGAETYGLSNRQDLITQRAYVSDIVFTSDINLRAINPNIQAVGLKTITPLVSGYIGNSLPYEITAISLSFDSTQSKQLNTAFHIYRLPDSPFSSKKYYSSGPLRTADHIRVINELEATLK